MPSPGDRGAVKRVGRLELFRAEGADRDANVLFLPRVSVNRRSTNFTSLSLTI